MKILGREKADLPQQIVMNWRLAAYIAALCFRSAARPLSLFPRPIQLSSTLPSTFVKPSLMSRLVDIAPQSPPLPPTSADADVFLAPGFSNMNPIKRLRSFTNLLSSVSERSDTVLVKASSGGADRLHLYRAFEVVSRMGGVVEPVYHASQGGNKDAFSFRRVDFEASPPAPMDDAATVVESTKKWVSKYLVQANLCPYTSSSLMSSTGLKMSPPGRIAYGVSDYNDDETPLSTFLSQVRSKRGANACEAEKDACTENRTCSD